MREQVIVPLLVVLVFAIGAMFGFVYHASLYPCPPPTVLATPYEASPRP